MSYRSSTTSSKASSTDATTPLLQSRDATERDVERVLPSKPVPERAVQKWNEPTINTWRVLATFFSFIVVGANDAYPGVRPDPFPPVLAFLKSLR